MGSFRRSRMGTTTPPFALPSSLVSTRSVTPATRANTSACCRPFWPVVASSTSSTRWGASGITFWRLRRILSSSFMRWSLVWSRPAVSMSTQGVPLARALVAPSKAMAAGSPPIWLRMTGTPARSPQRSSWSMAAARKVSPATTSTPSPRALRKAASLPRVVVLPTPLTPTRSTTWVSEATKGRAGRCRSSFSSSSFSTALGSISDPPRSSKRSRAMSWSTALTPRSAWSSRSSSSSSWSSSRRRRPRRRPMGASTSSWVRFSPCLNLSNRPPRSPTPTSRLQSNEGEGFPGPQNSIPRGTTGLESRICPGGRRREGRDRRGGQARIPLRPGAEIHRSAGARGPSRQHEEQQEVRQGVHQVLRFLGAQAARVHGDPRGPQGSWRGRRPGAHQLTDEAGQLPGGLETAGWRGLVEGQGRQLEDEGEGFGEHGNPGTAWVPGAAGTSASGLLGIGGRHLLRLAQVLQQHRIAGPQGQGGLEVVAAGGVPLQVEAGDAAVEQSLQLARRQLQGLVEGRLSVGPSLVLQGRAAQVVPGVGGLGIGLDRLPEDCGRLVEVPQVGQGLALPAQGLGIPGFAGEQGARVGQEGLPIPGQLGFDAGVGVAFGLAQPAVLGVGRHGLPVPAELAEGLGPVEPVGAEAG